MAFLPLSDFSFLSPVIPLMMGWTVPVLIRVMLLITMVIWSKHVLAEQENDPCIRERRPLSIEWPGCDPTSTKVPTCHGTCKSFDVVIPTAPYFRKECNCCKSLNHSIKKRQLSFSCNGRVENHTVFLPIIETCACIQCQVF